MQRLFDVIAAGLGLAVFAPAGLVIMLVLRLTGEGKVFYRQERVGKGGGPFGMLKFVTMLEDSPNLGAGDITEKDDPRVLPVGRFLRKTKLNEVPQLVNVLLGDMSLVGPRPLTTRNFAYYSEHVRKRISTVRPGLTGVGSIVFRDEEAILARASGSPLETYRNEISPYKGRLELWYLDHRSLGLYFVLLFLTAWVVVFPRSGLHLRLLRALPTRQAEPR